MTGPTLLRRPAPTTVTPVGGRRVQATEPTGTPLDGPMVAPTPGCHVQAAEPDGQMVTPDGPMAAPTSGRRIQATEPAESGPDGRMVTPGGCPSRWTGGWVA